ncbi:MAG: hypothetical protein JW846_07300 [Dehalococcoidia bacterium]|nr:hypothetical protein [Dehalococcoidia bacterium]
MSEPLGDSSSRTEVTGLERRMVHESMKDGLGDLCLGVCVLAWGLAIRFDLAAFIGAFCAVAVTMVWPLKKWLTYPRVGAAKPGTQMAMNKRFMMLLAGMALFGIVAFSLVSQGPGAFIREYFPVVFGVVFAIFLSVVGYWLGVARFHVYGLLLALAGAVHQWGGVDLWTTVATAGLLILIPGAWVLIRFLRDNPVRGETPDE